ncbi:polycomb group RING finger protein 1-like [Limulus polyphemus]|uniref:Polycomb group RING finger protein 1-like n=1 Tax=Limulus polyphemus TaxID=6850 RepID=A0ABM1B635_LIMPO|nr:polycomb group RING finger protein 1-like [Limulus polyphemus]
MEEKLNIRIRDLNPHIVCILCAGYFIDATTITECLHTFCKSCIVKFLQTSKHCPMCNIKVHETQPLLNLKSDRTLQDIVYKIVPSLWENELKQREDFEKMRGLTETNTEGCKEEEDSNKEDGLSNQHLYIHDELVHVQVEPLRNGPSTRDPFIRDGRQYVRCSVRAQIYHLKKLIRKLWPETMNKEVEIVCNGKVMSDHYCLKRVWLSSWKDKNPPLVLQFYMKKKPL